VLREFNIPTKGVVCTTGQQLYEDFKAKCNEMPHAYLTMVKDDPSQYLSSNTGWKHTRIVEQQDADVHR
jgi:hypothetical protein